MASAAALSSIGGVSLHQAYSDQSTTAHRRLSSGLCQRLKSTHAIRPSHVSRSGACLGVSAKAPSERAAGEVRARGSVHKVEECCASATSSSALPAGTKIEASSVLTRLSVGLGLAAAFALAPFLLPRTNLPRYLLSTPVAFASTAVADAPAATDTPAAPSGEGASDSATSADARVEDATAEGTVETAQVMSTPRVTATSRIKASTSAPADVAEAGTSATPERVQAAEVAKEAEAPKVPASTPVPVSETPAATSEPATAGVATSAPAKPAAVKPAPAKVEVATSAPAKAAVATPAVDVTGKTGDGDVIAGIKIALIKGLNAVSKVLEPSATTAGAPATSARGKPLNTDYANPKFIYPFVSLVAGLVLMAAGVLAQIRLLFKDDVKPKAPDGPLPFPTARLSNAPRPKTGTSGLVRGASFGERSVPPSAKFSFKAVPVGSKPASPPPEVPSAAGSDASAKSPQGNAVVEAEFASEGAAKATEVPEVVQG